MTEFNMGDRIVMTASLTIRMRGYGVIPEGWTGTISRIDPKVDDLVGVQFDHSITQNGISVWVPKTSMRKTEPIGIPPIRARFDMIGTVPCYTDPDKWMDWCRIGKPSQ